MSLCKVNLIGYIGKAAELKFTPQGQAVCEFYLGVNNDKSKSSSNAEDKATWFRISIWGKQAENISQYLSKGKQVYIEGHLKVKHYVSKDGSYRINLDVNATEYQLLGSSNNSQTSKANTNNATVDPYVDTDVDVEDPFFAG